MPNSSSSSNDGSARREVSEEMKRTSPQLHRFSPQPKIFPPRAGGVISSRCDGDPSNSTNLPSQKRIPMLTSQDTP
ncbi:unnamed protein product [Nippostrongylus brasiliensis]|uniref:Uncharacterized protein n=1 Tax=Nippostrongylus brasiliensis TaxID=27835 RepID=A0A0N4YG83_NIPBR|nr:unnamed protein product [Nippostrongylus brasiliensis]